MDVKGEVGKEKQVVVGEEEAVQSHFMILNMPGGLCQHHVDLSHYGSLDAAPQYLVF